MGEGSAAAGGHVLRKRWELSFAFLHVIEVPPDDISYNLVISTCQLSLRWQAGC